ncbi:MAG TPA: crosslink repair DNA glycosylase YcaQ family protein [Candidatus Limnocylindrales bacterium]|nr:crosslink repair DNA glycosylase YcaQ family protein [Candidatus Limnocylindrales bacterium]
MTATLSRDQVLRYRARASHLDAKLPAGSFAAAAWGGLQDSIPRAGVMSLHARVVGTQPDSWEDPSVVQIWFRGGADYIVPRADAGVFTLGSYPRDPDEGRRLEALADDIHRGLEGRTLRVAELSERLRLAHQTHIRGVAVTGRVHIRWDASNIWLIPVERPGIDVDDARRELARRFLHWYAPATVATMARWTGVRPAEARATWADIERELVPVDVEGAQRFALAADLEALEHAEPITGVRLLPMDDPLTKLDKELLVRDEELRRRVVPPYGAGPGYIPGAILVDGEIVGGWQRQGRKVTIHPFTRLSAAVREAIEAEALAFPVAGTAPLSVTWD